MIRYLLINTHGGKNEELREVRTQFFDGYFTCCMFTEQKRRQCKENVKVTYKEGTYTGTSTGYNGPINLSVTFTKDGISEIDYSDNKETNHIGTPAFDYLVADAKEANGAGIDVVSGATFTSIGFKNALIDAAKQAEASDLDGFKKNTVEHKAGEAIEKTTDVVVVGAGGAGMATAVQSAQNGNSVVVLEVNAEIGGNTVASGGQFQSAQSYLVWDSANPDATTGVYKGVTYNKFITLLATSRY